MRAPSGTRKHPIPVHAVFIPRHLRLRPAAPENVLDQLIASPPILFLRPSGIIINRTPPLRRTGGAPSRGGTECWDHRRISTLSPATIFRRRKQWPHIPLDGFDYPEYLNAAVRTDRPHGRKGFGDHTALIGNGRRRTYKELADWTNRIAHALVEDFGVKPGNRVLIRSANNPAMVACWLAATKAGAVVVNTMPMLRAGELGKIVDKAEISLALCDTRLHGRTRRLRQGQHASSKRHRLRRHRQSRRRTRPRRARQAGALRGGQDRARRCGAARLHLRNDRLAQGDRCISIAIS